MLPDTLQILSKFSFPRVSERNEAERGRSILRVSTCFDAVEHFPACFSVLHALPNVPSQLTDANSHFHVGASEAKQSEAVLS